MAPADFAICCRIRVSFFVHEAPQSDALILHMHTLPKLQIHITASSICQSGASNGGRDCGKVQRGWGGEGRKERQRTWRDWLASGGFPQVNNANSIIVYQRKSPLSLFLIYNNDIHIWQSFLVSEKLLRLMWLMSIWSRNLSFPQRFPHLIRSKGGIIYLCQNGMKEV